MNSQLSADDWIQAGFAILAEEGIKALTAGLETAGRSRKCSRSRSVRSFGA